MASAAMTGSTECVTAGGSYRFGSDVIRYHSGSGPRRELRVVGIAGRESVYGRSRPAQGSMMRLRMA